MPSNIVHVGLQQTIAVQSYCFRGYSNNEEVATKVKEIGLTALEPCKVHIDFSNLKAQDTAVTVYQAAGIELVSCGVNLISGNNCTIQRPFQFAKKAGFSTISVDVMPPASWDTFVEIEKLAEEFEIDVAIHNHGGSHWLGNAQMLREVFQKTGPRIGLMLDTAWAIDSREDPVGMVQSFGSRLMGIHLKDFVYSRNREPKDVIIGTGILDLPALVNSLVEVGFRGVPIIEYEGDVKNPVPALVKCVQAVEQVWYG